MVSPVESRIDHANVILNSVVFVRLTTPPELREHQEKSNDNTNIITKPLVPKGNPP
jgi:hypothetical protein